MEKSMNLIVPGFKAHAVSAGLKKNKDLDMALIYSERDAVTAGAFTSNRVKAAPVLLSMEHLSDHRARAIVMNSGNANACTGETGLRDSREIARITADLLHIHQRDVLVASTGVIGQPLDMNCVTRAIPRLVSGLSENGLSLAAQAIMTTDSFPKTVETRAVAGDREYSISGIAKGAGMIMPDMATMLSFVLTDLAISKDLLERAVSNTVDSTFNRITVDGDTSTNDTVIVMANGMAGNTNLNSAEYDDFCHALEYVMGSLARMIVKDGEGATKLVKIVVKGALSREDASRAARTIANSNLVKTAFYGNDPNWGRIMAALGRANVDLREHLIDIFVDDVQIVSKGMGCGPDAESKAASKMSHEEFTLLVNLNEGEYDETILTCDLTHEYITINADYRT